MFQQRRSTSSSVTWYSAPRTTSTPSKPSTSVRTRHSFDLLVDSIVDELKSFVARAVRNAITLLARVVPDAVSRNHANIVAMTMAQLAQFQTACTTQQVSPAQLSRFTAALDLQTFVRAFPLGDGWLEAENASVY